MERGKWTFDNFEVDIYNRNAYQTSKDFIEKRMERGMMLCIFGLEGTGKTKLLQAIANHYMDVNPATIMYVTGHELYQELEKARRKKDIFILALKRQFRKAEVICIENVRELLSDEEIQPWFMDWFHYCKRHRKRMIYTHECDEKLYCAIQELSTLDERATTVGIPKAGQNRTLEVVKILD